MKKILILSLITLFACGKNESSSISDQQSFIPSEDTKETEKEELYVEKVKDIELNEINNFKLIQNSSTLFEAPSLKVESIFKRHVLPEAGRAFEYDLLYKNNSRQLYEGREYFRELSCQFQFEIPNEHVKQVNLRFWSKGELLDEIELSKKSNSLSTKMALPSDLCGLFFRKELDLTISIKNIPLVDISNSTEWEEKGRGFIGVELGGRDIKWFGRFQELTWIENLEEIDPNIKLINGKIFEFLNLRNDSLNGLYWQIRETGNKKIISYGKKEIKKPKKWVKYNVSLHDDIILKKGEELELVYEGMGNFQETFDQERRLDFYYFYETPGANSTRIKKEGSCNVVWRDIKTKTQTVYWTEAPSPFGWNGLKVEKRVYNQGRKLWVLFKGPGIIKLLNKVKGEKVKRGVHRLLSPCPTPGVFQQHLGSFEVHRNYIYVSDKNEVKDYDLIYNYDDINLEGSLLR
jgi:hypothetical protein